MKLLYYYLCYIICHLIVYIFTIIKLNHVLCSSYIFRNQFTFYFLRYIFNSQISSNKLIFCLFQLKKENILKFRMFYTFICCTAKYICFIFFLNIDN